MSVDPLFSFPSRSLCSTPLRSLYLLPDVHYFLPLIIQLHLNHRGRLARLLQSCDDVVQLLILIVQHVVVVEQQLLLLLPTHRFFLIN